MINCTVTVAFKNIIPDQTGKHGEEGQRMGVHALVTDNDLRPTA